jgi:CheY-like chemotaxis protein
LRHDEVEKRDASEAGSDRRRRILVVEDDEETAEALILLLEEFGHDASTANNGVTGLVRARELLPHAMLCDIDLPDMSGYELARAVRAEACLDATLLIAVSGYTRQEDRERASAAGFDVHVGKPIDLDLLERTLLGPSTSGAP